MKDSKKKGVNKMQVTLGTLLVIALLGLAFVSYGYYDATQKIDVLTQAQNEMSQEEIDTLLAQVSAHILLPSDETPAIATIFDAAALAETQSFFEQAVDGDKVIIYSDKAIIFRPKEGLIINVGPVIKDTPPVELGEDGQPLNPGEITNTEGEELVETPEVVEEVIPAEEPVAEVQIEEDIETLAESAPEVATETMNEEDLVE